MREFCAHIAGLDWLIRARHEDVVRLCADYLCDGVGISCDSFGANDAVRFVSCIRIVPTQSDIELERERAFEKGPFSDGYLETVAVLRAMAEAAPLHGRMLMHGVVLEYEGMGYMFCAPSGTGKTTHARLWRRYLGDAASVINGDKPFVFVPPAASDASEGSFDERGRFFSDDLSPVAYGSPWAGKEGWQRNASAPLAGICFISRLGDAEECAARGIKTADALGLLARHVYFPQDDAARASTLGMMDALLRKVPMYALSCDMSESAVKASFEALTGKAYHRFI